MPQLVRVKFGAANNNVSELYLLVSLDDCNTHSIMNKKLDEILESRHWTQEELDISIYRDHIHACEESGKTPMTLEEYYLEIYQKQIQ